MHIEEIRAYCLMLPGVTESMPFGPDTLVMKVNGHVFLIASLDSFPLQFNVKCDPEEAALLRDRHPAIQPGYHMNKLHWNTILVDGSLSDAFLRQQIDTSYRLNAAKKPR